MNPYAQWAGLALTYLSVIICFLIFIRLFTFQRNGARFRRGVSLMATAVMACCGSLVIYVLSGRLVMTATDWPMVGMLAFFGVSVFRCRGNLAGVLEYSRGWRSYDRRRNG